MGVRVSGTGTSLSSENGKLLPPSSLDFSPKRTRNGQACSSSSIFEGTTRSRIPMSEPRSGTSDILSSRSHLLIMFLGRSECPSPAVLKQMEAEKKKASAAQEKVPNKIVQEEAQHYITDDE